MRQHQHHIRKDRHQAVTDLLARCTFTRSTETVPLTQAVGRVVAQTMYSLHDLPNKPTSKMDAIAVRMADFENGQPDTSSWERGNQFQFCNTGVAMPEGFDTAIAIERVTLNDNDRIEALDGAPQAVGDGVNPVGSALSRNAELVTAATQLKPAHVALLAMGGHTQIPVVARPRVIFIPTGNELVPVQPDPPAGKNIDCNSFNLFGKLLEWGAEPCLFPLVKDDWDALANALRTAAASADIVVINAGSSKGSDDYTCEVLETYGEVLSHETNMAPGKHASCSLLDGTPVIGISGPPLAADLNAEMFVKPVVDAFLYGTPRPAPTVTALTTDTIPAPPMTRTMNMAKRVKLTRREDGALCAHLIPTEAPALKGCAQADGLLIIPAGSTGYEVGEPVDIELLSPYRVEW